MEEKDLKALFNKYQKDGFLDREGFNSLTQNELKTELGIDEHQSETIFMLLDNEGSKKIAFDQLYKWYCKSDKLDAVKDSLKCRLIQKAVQTFKRFDKNANGTIERDELEHLLKSLSFDAKMQQNAFETLDKDNNGKISFPEFLCWLQIVPSVE